MKSASEMLKLRDEKYKNWLEVENKIKGQWDLIESRVSSYNMGHSSKYISVGNIGELYKENERKLIDLGYKIVVTKAETRLYFDSKAYNDYLISNRTERNIARDSKYINSKPKENLKNTSIKQVDEKNKLKCGKEHINRLHGWNKNEDAELSDNERDLISDLVKTLYNSKRLYF